jgi:tRNA threonylcarbamoyl adenosine modification protein YeaZ
MERFPSKRRDFAGGMGGQISREFSKTNTVGAFSFWGGYGADYRDRIVKILALETSTDIASLAFGQGERILWKHAFEAHRKLSSDLALHVDAALKQMGVPDVVAVGLGPGSYAGVRVAIATAVGLSAVLGCELLGIPSVAAFPVPGESFQVIGDARRGSWYYSQIQEGICTRGPSLASSVEELREWVRSGSGPVWSFEACEAVELDIQRGVPSAEWLCRLAMHRRGVFSTGDLEPLYLREATITRPGA